MNFRTVFACRLKLVVVPAFLGFERPASKSGKLPVFVIPHLFFWNHWIFHREQAQKMINERTGFEISY